MLKIQPFETPASPNTTSSLLCQRQVARSLSNDTRRAQRPRNILGALHSVAHESDCLRDVTFAQAQSTLSHVNMLSSCRPGGSCYIQDPQGKAWP